MGEQQALGVTGAAKCSCCRSPLIDREPCYRLVMQTCNVLCGGPVLPALNTSQLAIYCAGCAARVLRTAWADLGAR